MNYLDQINDKKAKAQAKADAEATANKIADAVNKNQSHMAQMSADAANMTKKVAEIQQNNADLVSQVILTNKTQQEGLERLIRDTTEVIKRVENLEIKAPDVIMPDITIPDIVMPEHHMDMQPIADAISELKDDSIDISDYFAHDIKEDGDVQYVGMLNPEGQWIIIENQIKANTLRFVAGNGDYTKAFKKAASYQYGLLSEALNGEV